MTWRFTPWRGRGPGAKLVIMGTGAELDALRDLAQACGLAEHVIFGGFTKDLAPLLPGFLCGDAAALAHTIHERARQAANR